MPTVQQLQQQLYYISQSLNRVQKAVCCISAGELTQVYTTDSPTVTWSGTGTQADPLVATVIGDAANPPNLLIAGTDASGNLIDGTANVITRPLTGFTVGTNTPITAANTILTAFQQVQGQINARTATTAATPSVPVGLTAVAGSGTTYMRANAAPALSQAIAPTWTSLHTFANQLVSTHPSGNTTPSIQISSTGPQLDFNSTSNAVDERRWNIVANPGGTLHVRALNDAGTTSLIAHAMTRTATAITQHDLFTGGTARLTIQNSGSLFSNPLGVGVTAPIGLFHVGTGASALSSPAVNAGMAMTNSTVYGNRIYFENLNNTTSQRVFMIGNYSNTFSLNMMADNATSFLQANIFTATATGVISMSSLAGTGVRSVVADAAGTLSTVPMPVVFEGAALPGDLTPYPEGSLFIIS